MHTKAFSNSYIMLVTFESLIFLLNNHQEFNPLQTSKFVHKHMHMHAQAPIVIICSQPNLIHMYTYISRTSTWVFCLKQCDHLSVKQKTIFPFFFFFFFFFFVPRKIYFHTKGIQNTNPQPPPDSNWERRCHLAQIGHIAHSFLCHNTYGILTLTETLMKPCACQYSITLQTTTSTTLNPHWNQTPISPFNRKFLSCRIGFLSITGFRLGVVVAWPVKNHRHIPK
jgi:hypothetical protein